MDSQRERDLERERERISGVPAPTVFSLLIVEDEPVLREAMSRVLARRGHFVRTASTVMEAEVLTRDEAFDCGVFDIELGSEDGVSLAGRLLSEGRIGAAVFFSGTTNGGARQRAAAIGPFIHKEQSFTELLRAVEDRASRAVGK